MNTKEIQEAIKDGWCPNCEPGKLTPMMESCPDCKSNPNNKLNCQTCTNPTKYVVGFWDGENDSGYIYNCDNVSCPTKQENIEKACLLLTKRDEVDRINQGYGISAKEIKAKRRELGVTIRKMADQLGVYPSTYSNYETCRDPLPVELKEKIEEVFRRSDNYSESVTWPIKFKKER